jgi:hypothetical protein
VPIDWPTSPATNDTYSFGGLTWRFDGSGWRLINGPTTAGISTVKDEGTTLTARSILNFTGAGVTATDNSGTGATDITIPGGGGTSDYLWLF